MRILKRASLKTQIFILIIIHIASIPILVTLYYNHISKDLISKKSAENIDITKILQKSIQSQYAVRRL